MRPNLDVELQGRKLQVRPWSLRDRDNFDRLIKQTEAKKLGAMELIARIALKHVCDDTGKPLFPSVNPDSPTESELANVWNEEALLVEDAFDAVIEYNKTTTAKRADEKRAEEEASKKN